MNSTLSKYISDLCSIDTWLEKAQDKEIIYFCAFEQVWGSTTLGFGGCGGSTMTSAMTTIIQTEDFKYYVFFGGRIAYCVDNPTEEFKKDVQRGCMKSCAEAHKVY